MHPEVEQTLKEITELEFERRIVRPDSDIGAIGFLVTLKEGETTARMDILALAPMFMSDATIRKIPGAIEHSWRIVQREETNIKLLAVIMIHEVWVASIPALVYNDPSVRVLFKASQQPNRTECIHFFVCEPTEEHSILYEINRKASPITFHPFPQKFDMEPLFGSKTIFPISAKW